MTMHLLGPQFTTLKNSRRKPLKVTDKVMQDFREYNKLMRRCNSKEKTLEEYLVYRSGKSKVAKKKGLNPIPSYKSNHRSQYPSFGDEAGSIPAKPEKTYTGTFVKGIAVSHKSNLIPITSQEQAEDVAKMRRS